jgi:hypothetical protein
MVVYRLSMVVRGELSLGCRPFKLSATTAITPIRSDTPLLQRQTKSLRYHSTHLLEAIPGRLLG